MERYYIKNLLGRLFIADSLDGGRLICATMEPFMQKSADLIVAALNSHDASLLAEAQEKAYQDDLMAKGEAVAREYFVEQGIK